MAEISFTYAGREFSCEVDQKWRRSLSIQIRPDGSVLVRAPKIIPLFLVQKQVEEKAAWIYKKVLYFEKHAHTKAPKTYQEGEVHTFLGEKYTLKTVIGENDSVVLNDGTITITSKRISPVIVKSLLSAWYHEQGVKILYERFELACRMFQDKGIVPASLSYKPMKGKWGYCTHDNHISLSPELVKTPLECIDYVVYHELCHVKHHDHGSKFHALQKEMLPDYRLRKKKLDAYGS
ncbi:M48 family metallopeptidase [Candidatus Woesebacteria bacterium]|nr:M48 family metallopeptidase [Candidatus Woesebacteria bacterium]